MHKNKHIPENELCLKNVVVVVVVGLKVKQ